MKLTYLFVALGLIIVVIALVAALNAGADLMRRRRGIRDGTVIADSQVEFETDVGKSPDAPP